MSIKVKKCPFCLGRASVRKLAANKFRIVCSQCGTMGPEGKDPEKSASVWNDRWFEEQLLAAQKQVKQMSVLKDRCEVLEGQVQTLEATRDRSTEYAELKDEYDRSLVESQAMATQLESKIRELEFELEEARANAGEKTVETVEVHHEIQGPDTQELRQVIDQLEGNLGELHQSVGQAEGTRTKASEALRSRVGRIKNRSRPAPTPAKASKPSVSTGGFRNVSVDDDPPA